MAEYSTKYFGNRHKLKNIFSLSLYDRVSTISCRINLKGEYMDKTTKSDSKKKKEARLVPADRSSTDSESTKKIVFDCFDSFEALLESKTDVDSMTFEEWGEAFADAFFKLGKEVL
jgi:hypothetical protein